MDNFYIENTRITSNQAFQSKGGDVMFVNLSTTDTVTISGFPLAPGGYLVDTANAGERNKTTYSIDYGTGTDKMLYIREKVFN